MSSSNISLVLTDLLRACQMSGFSLMASVKRVHQAQEGETFGGDF
ncbi:MAG: hypothetical protein ACFFAS_13635 [Promethearchaeota archaeon]